jgi:hypothetical protein
MGLSIYALAHVLLTTLMAQRVEFGLLPKAKGAAASEGEGRSLRFDRKMEEPLDAIEMDKW